MLTRSLWHVDQHTSGIISQDLPHNSSDTTLTSLYSLISIGTERLVCQGKVPDTLYERMKVPFMDGKFSLPVKYGYSLIGLAGNKVYHVMHPHQDSCSVPFDHLKSIPDNISPIKATLISNLETACTAYWDADPRQDENILIVGFGLIGALIAGWLKLKGFDKISILENNEYRRNYARKLGFTLIQLSEHNSFFQVAFHCTASESGLQSCIDLMDQEGRIIELSWYGNAPVSLHLGNSFHYKRLSIQSSQVSSIPFKLKDKHSFKSRKDEVIRMLADPFWDLYIDKVINFEEAPEWFDYIRFGSIEALSLIIKY